MKFASYAYGGELAHIALDDACASTIFERDEREILGKFSFLDTGAPTNIPFIEAPKKPGKRSNLLPRARLPWMETKLVISKIASHSATNLCNSANSWGPDFATPNEGKLCDMSTKTLYTLCSSEDIDGCVEISTSSGNGTANQLSVATRKLSVAKRTVSSPLRTYEETAVWGTDS